MKNGALNNKRKVINLKNTKTAKKIRSKNRLAKK